MNETKNFKDSEWRCKCGCNQPHKMDSGTMLKVQALREIYGKPLTLTSAWRCKNHPSESRKKSPGQHNKGAAVDIAVTSGNMAYKLIKIALTDLGCKGFAVGNGFVHLDWREATPVTWKY